MPARRAQPSLPTRLVASATALLVAVLTVFAASPALHVWLHEHSAHMADAHANCPHSHDAPAAPDSGDGDDLCVVTQFAHGKADFAHAPTLAPGAVLRVSATLSLSAAPAPRAPALFFPPACGPPLA
ncbi:MAG: hypothetical protein FJ397_08535 [Verrucomicrobia bacterium]|nr:hypothetical protein [Verrucomicrobiota bacterium]